MVSLVGLKISNRISAAEGNIGVLLSHHTRLGFGLVFDLCGLFVKIVVEEFVKSCSSLRIGCEEADCL